MNLCGHADDSNFAVRRSVDGTRVGLLIQIGETDNGVQTVGGRGSGVRGLVIAGGVRQYCPVGDRLHLGVG